MNDSPLSASEVVGAHVDAVWRNGDVDRALGYLAETSWRHETGIEGSDPVRAFSLKAQRERISREAALAGEAEFQIVKLLESGEFATMVWDLTCRIPADEAEALRAQGYYFDDQNRLLTKGIQAFRVVDGKIVETWATQGPWFPGHWGETKTDHLATTDPAAKAPDEVVRDYVTRIWNQEDPSAIGEYLAESCWRHDAGEPERQFMHFDHAFQRQRAEEGYANGGFDFQMLEMLVSGDYITMIWDLNMSLKKEELRAGMQARGAQFDQNGNIMLHGMEVFHVVNGKVVEVWVGQCWDLKGHWGRTMSRQ